MIFLGLLAIPLIVAAVSFVLSRGIDWREFGAQVLAQLVIAAISAAVMLYANTSDTEILNGRVVSKTRERVHCRHSYPCHCRSVSCGKNCTTTKCDTCYRHGYDIDWDIQTTLGRTFTIDTKDSQGLIEPAFWTRAVKGDPVAVPHTYENFVQAAPGTLFRHQGLTEKYARALPEYPLDVFGYYSVKRLVTVGPTVRYPEQWNAALSEVAAEVGIRKQANPLVVLTDKPRDYFSALEQHWIGGKKNDVIVVIGVSAEFAPQWVEVMAWTTRPIVKIKIRDDVMMLDRVDPQSVADIVQRDILAYYQRKPMKDFEYLSATITPTPLGWAISMIIGILAACGIAWFFHKHEVFT